MPKEVEHRSLTTLREKPVKIGAKVASHGRYVTFQMAEVAVPKIRSGKSCVGSTGCGHGPHRRRLTKAAVGSIDGRGAPECLITDQFCAEKLAFRSRFRRS